MIRPSYNALKRYVKICKNKGIARSVINDNITAMMKRRDLYWLRSELSWYE